MRTTLVHANASRSVALLNNNYEVVTEVFKDGRIRLRGALPEQTSVVKKPRNPRAGKRNSSGKKS